MTGRDDIAGARARAYLDNARKCADLANAAYLPDIQTTPGANRDFVAQMAIMNALAAIAEMTVPPPPGMRG